MFIPGSGSILLSIFRKVQIFPVDNREDIDAEQGPGHGAEAGLMRLADRYRTRTERQLVQTDHMQKGSSVRTTVIGFTSLLLLLFWMLTGCGTTEPVDTRGTLKATVDRTFWSGIESTARREGEKIEIEGASAIGATIHLSILGDTVGTYPLGEGRHEGRYSDLGVNWVVFGTNDGSLTVTTIDDDHIEGYFGFQGRDTAGLKAPVNVTSGMFNLSFSQ